MGCSSCEARRRAAEAMSKMPKPLPTPIGDTQSQSTDDQLVNSKFKSPIVLPPMKK